MPTNERERLALWGVGGAVGGAVSSFTTGIGEDRKTEQSSTVAARTNSNPISTSSSSYSSSEQKLSSDGVGVSAGRCESREDALSALVQPSVNLSGGPSVISSDSQSVGQQAVVEPSTSALSPVPLAIPPTPVSASSSLATNATSVTSENAALAATAPLSGAGNTGNSTGTHNKPTKLGFISRTLGRLKSVTGKNSVDHSFVASDHSSVGSAIPMTLSADMDVHRNNVGSVPLTVSTSISSSSNSSSSSSNSSNCNSISCNSNTSISSGSNSSGSGSVIHCLGGEHNAVEQKAVEQNTSFEQNGAPGGAAVSANTGATSSWLKIPKDITWPGNPLYSLLTVY